MDVEATADGPAPPPTDATRLDRFNCHLCSRSYERQDHLSRHLKSHDNERKYKCLDCGKGFNRADLLQRHRAAHVKHTSVEHFRRRVGKSCESCIRAKTKCDEERPCRRCQNRGTPCVATDRLRPLTGTDRVQPDPGLSAREDDAARTILDLSNSADFGAGRSTMEPSDACQQAHGIDPAQMYEPGFDFFDAIMNFETAGDNLRQPVGMNPPDVFDFMQDVDLNTFDFDFNLLESGLTRPPTPGPTVASGSHTADTPRSDIELRSEAFDRSPWSWNQWIPPSKHSSFAGINEIRAPQQRLQPSDQLTPKAPSVRIQLETEARDRLLRLVSQMGDSRVAISSFPSLELLRDLIGIFSVQEASAVHNFIHMASFDPRNARTEILLAVVAAGARYVALAPVWRMGLVMQEVIRVAVGSSIEKDNAMTRDLQHLQSWLLMLNIGIWSGFRRKTEVASAFLQTSLAMLTWSNAFSRVPYKDIVPSWNDNDEELLSKWKAWAHQESFKRLCFRYFIHDSQVSIAHLQNPLISPAQMMLPLPASKSVWTASDASSWRTAYLSARQCTDGELPSAIVLSNDIKLLDTLEGKVDKNLSVLIACHSMAYEVFHFRQQALILSRGHKKPRHDRLLAHSSRQKEIYDDLISMDTYCELQPSPLYEALFTLEYLMMSLHVSLDDIQRFSGRSGEEEARAAYPQILAWTEDAASRIAVWHAGQLFRIARRLERTRLRDFYAVALYHATLTLWVYGMVTSNTARRSRAQTPASGGRPFSQPNDTALHDVVIDRDDDRTAKAFRHLGHGRPCLTISQASSGSQACPLQNPSGVMTLAAQVLEGNFPKGASSLPPLVENLVNLMTDLSRLSGRPTD